MSVSPEHFARIAGRVDVPLLATKLTTVIGVGTVGSQVARELANSGVGRLVLIDHDLLEEPNLIRHALPREYLGMNKAEAMTVYLAAQVPTLRPAALSRKVDSALSDTRLDEILKDADLIVAATDDREAQRRVARRALALDIPAVFPALYGDNGGEVFVQRSPRNPCFFCWDGYRNVDERLRGVEALNADTLPVLQLAVQLSLGVLDPRSEYAGLMAAPRSDSRPRQLFIQRRFAALEMAPQARRFDCPNCAVGPAPSGDARTQSVPGAPFRRPAPVRKSMPPTFADIRSELASFLLLALATVTPIGILTAVLVKGHINNPSFGVAIVGLCCSVGFMVGAVATIVAFASLSWRARAVAVAICCVAALGVWGVKAVRSGSPYPHPVKLTDIRPH